MDLDTVVTVLVPVKAYIESIERDEYDPKIIKVKVSTLSIQLTSDALQQVVAHLNERTVRLDDKNTEHLVLRCVVAHSSVEYTLVCEEQQENT